MIFRVFTVDKIRKNLYRFPMETKTILGQFPDPQNPTIGVKISGDETGEIRLIPVQNIEVLPDRTVLTLTLEQILQIRALGEKQS